MIDAALAFARTFRDWADLIGLGVAVVFVLAVLGYLAIALAARVLRPTGEQTYCDGCRRFSPGTVCPYCR